MTDDLTRAAWRKSSYSGSGNACVEVRRSGDGFALRDSKNPAVGLLTFPDRTWSAFRTTVTDGHPGH